MTLWGLDLGGTKIEGAILDPANPGQAVHRLRLPTESHLGYDHILGQIRRVVEQLETASGQKRPAKLGIGTPGATEPATGTMKNSNTTCLIGKPLRDDVSACLGLEAVLANDANCFALAEATLGAARDYPVVMGLILGTGVGGGLVVHGRLLEGLHGIAGEWGHNPISGETTPCYCGRNGCVETVLAGPSLERFYRENGGAEGIRLPEIVSRASAGDAVAQATLTRLQDKFGEAIAAIINVLDPDAIVIGGGVGNIDVLYTAEAREAVLRHTFNPEIRTEFLKPALGDSAGVFGAAMLCASRP
ncbi:MAG: ROK family protein [Terrimicrobiaceae bacterium]